MILTPNYSLQKPEPGDNLKASQGYLATSFDTIDARLKANNDTIVSNGNTLATKADKLSPTLTPSAVGAVGLRVDGNLGQTGNLAEFRNSTGTVLAKVTADGDTEARISTAQIIQGISQAAGTRPLLVKGAASQTANLAEFQDSAGAILAMVSPGGGVTAGGSALLGRITAYATSAADKGLVVRGAASQTANLAEFQNSAGTVLSHVNAFGEVESLGVRAIAHVAGQRPLTVRGAASQTANLTEWQNSAGTVLTAIEPDGRLNFHSGLVNGSGAVPASASGFFVIRLGGTAYRVPYFPTV